MLLLPRGVASVVRRRRRRPTTTTTTTTTSAESLWNDWNGLCNITNFRNTKSIGCLCQTHQNDTKTHIRSNSIPSKQQFSTINDTLWEPKMNINSKQQRRRPQQQQHQQHQHPNIISNSKSSHRIHVYPILAYRHSTLQTRKSSSILEGSEDPTTTMMMMMRMPTLEEWKETMERLLDENVYPIGFSNMPQSISLVTSWCQQVSRVLQQTTVFVVPSSNDTTATTMEPALQILDRLFLEQEAYLQAVAENDGVTIGDNGVLMSPDISSLSIATALETWKLSLEHPNSSKHNTEHSLAWERVARYGNYLANHDGSMLSQISKVIGPIRRTNRSIPTATTTTTTTTMAAVVVVAAPIEDPSNVDTALDDNDSFITLTNLNPVADTTPEAPMIVQQQQQEQPQLQQQHEAFRKKDYAVFDDDHLLGIPLHRFNNAKNNVDKLIKNKRDVENDNNLSATGELINNNFVDTDEYLYRRVLLAGNDWDVTYRRLVGSLNDDDNFPIGFTNDADPEVVDLWYSELEQLLWHTNVSVIRPAFEIIDRWHEEQKVQQQQQHTTSAASQPMRARPMASFALHNVLQCWLSLLDRDDDIKNELTPEVVWDKISAFRVSQPERHGETSLSLIVRAVGIIEVPERAPIRANAIVQSHLEILNSSVFGQQHLNNILIRHLLQLWYRSKLPEAAVEGDRLLSLLKDWYNTYRRIDQIPDDDIYANIISLWVAGASPGRAIYRAEVLMNEMQREPSFIVLGTFIDALAKVGHVERAHTLLNKYIRRQTDKLELRPRSVETMKSFEGCNPILSIFEAYRSRLDRQPLVAIVQMERFVSQLEKLASDFDAMRNIFHPNVACYNVLIGGYSHLRTPHKAEGLLGHVMRLLSESTDKVIAADQNHNQPVVTLFNNVLNALAQSGEVEAVPRAIALVRNMETKCRDDPFYQSNVETYSLLLYCLAYDRRTTIADNARETEVLLERMKTDKTGYMPKPNANCYDIVLRTWCRAGYPDHAETILLQLCEDSGAFDMPDDKPIDKSFPTSVQFLIVMEGWVSVARRRNGHHQALSRVEQLLQKMHTLHLKGFQTKPTITAHNMFLECLAKSEENYAPERAESFLLLMDKHGKEDPSLIPDVVIYNSVLNTWLRSNRYDAPMKSTALFQKMKNMKDGSVRVINSTSYITMMGIYTQHAMPNKVQHIFDELMQTEDSKLRIPLTAYTTLMHAWSLAGKPDNVQTILQQMKKEYNEGRLTGPARDATIAFNSVLKCFLDSKMSDASDNAKVCLDFMSTLSSSGKFDVRPNHTSYSLVIKSLIYTKHNDAGRRAVHIFNEMKTQFMECGDLQIRPDLKIYTDLVSVLTKSNLPTYSVAEAAVKIDATNSTDLTTFDLLHNILEEMDGLVNPSCWVTQGEASLSRMAWYITETNILSVSEKVSLMFKLRRLADQHSVKLDHTIMLVLKNFRQMESSSPNSSSTTPSLDSSTTAVATNV